MESSAAQAFTLLTKWWWDAPNIMTMGKLWMSLNLYRYKNSFWRESPIECYQYWKVFHFSTCLRKLENSHFKEICEYKEWGKAFNDVSYIRKHMKIPDAKSVSVLTLENFSVTPVFTDMWELILEGTLGIKSMWGCLSLSSALSGHKIIYTENRKYKCYENRITYINIPCLVWATSSFLFSLFGFI